MDDRFDRLSTAAGVAAPVVLLVTVGVGAAVSKAYDWPTEPFSIVGGSGEPVSLAFNVGLVVAGLLALPFARLLWRVGRRAVGGLYVLVALSLVGAGLFPIPTALHAVFGAGLLLGIPLVLLAAGVDDWRGGDRRSGATTLALGTAAFAVWLPYDLGIEAAQVGYGAAELVAFLALAVWSGWTASRLRARPPDGRADHRTDTAP